MEPYITPNRIGFPPRWLWNVVRRSRMPRSQKHEHRSMGTGFERSGNRASADEEDGAANADPANLVVEIELVDRGSPGRFQELSSTRSGKRLPPFSAEELLDEVRLKPWPSRSGPPDFCPENRTRTVAGSAPTLGILQDLWSAAFGTAHARPRVKSKWRPRPRGSGEPTAKLE